VAYSSLNYKDALAAAGHQGVNRLFPHVPGVDAAGTVVESGVYEFVEGDQVLVTGFEMGANRWGGFAEYIRVPADWIVPLPEGLTLKESMILGTAGLTAGLSVDALQKVVPNPQAGPVVVTGASGGVGSIAVALLSKLGYHVAAVTGKRSAVDFLRKLGAKDVLPRDEVDDRSDRPMLTGRWAGGIDTVGGNILTTILRSTKYFGCVAACGLTAGHGLSMTVYPFILRGITLSGIEAAVCPILRRHEIWWRLGNQWKLDCLGTIGKVIGLDQVAAHIDDMLATLVTGRIVVRIADESPANT
jgi:putative YhdH/YhfP family quinone oxidoreductase